MVRNVVIAVVALVVILVGVVAYAFFKPPEEASGPIEAIPLDVAGTQTAEADIGSTDVAEVPPTVTAAAAPTVPVSPTAAAPAEPAYPTAVAPTVPVSPTAAAPAEPTAPAPETASSELTVFEIVQDESEARFLIDEVLRGEPFTVVGTTNQIAGQVAVNLNNPSTAQVGVIQVNARTLTTDNDFRNRAIKNRILLTNEHEFVTFAPTNITGLPASGVVGETYSFQITGDLTITDVTRQVTFDATVTPVSETRIEGLASTAFPYADFELFIPDAPPVDAVEDEVRLELDFVAVAS